MAARASIVPLKVAPRPPRLWTLDEARRILDAAREPARARFTDAEAAALRFVLALYNALHSRRP